MQWFRLTALGAAIASLSLSLEGCFLKKHHPLPQDETSTSTAISSTLTTTTTTGSTSGGGGDHCAEWEEGGLICAECARGFDLVGGECFYSCVSDMEAIEVNKTAGKGICLDDTTFSECSDEIPIIWPNTKEKITSLRIFSAWQSAWPEGRRQAAWQSLVRYVRSNHIKVLIGTQITCNETDDDRDWRHVLELMRKIGVEHVMGLAVGNEMELLYTKDAVKQDPECIERMWKGGYFWNKTLERVAEMDLLGGDFEQVPVTSVFGGFALAGEPFIETEQAMVKSYIENATEKFGSRWAFSLNVYPYFDPGNNLDPHTTDQCNATIERCVCVKGAGCLTDGVVRTMRQRMQEVTNRSDDLLWIGETGWSHPMSDTLSTPVKHCPDFSSRQTFERNYRNFLSWDLELDGVKGPDHVFYFTMRDSSNFGIREHFGLIGKCGETECKLQKASNMTLKPRADESDVEGSFGSGFAESQLIV